MSFPLVPRGRLVGLSFGMMRSLRRGRGSDVANSRPYRTGDDIRAIDWASSARLSSARQTDEFVVRERFAEEAPRVVIACDLRPEMSYYAPPLPWLDKAAALRTCVELICEATADAGGFVGYLDLAEAQPYWEPPRSARKAWELRQERLGSAPFTASADTLERELAYLADHRHSVTSGSFVFVLSDFLSPPPERAWLSALERAWDVVPVVVQDPTWEQAFPDVGGLVVSFRDPRTGRIAPVRLTRREARARRRENETRLRGVLQSFHSLGLDWVVVSRADRAGALGSFLGWGETRLARRAA